jgi:hypothetical protein
MFESQSFDPQGLSALTDLGDSEADCGCGCSCSGGAGAGGGAGS